MSKMIPLQSLREEIERIPEEDRQYVSLEFSDWRKSQMLRPKSEHRYKMGDIKRCIRGTELDGQYVYDSDAAKRTVVRFNSVVREQHKLFDTQAQLRRQKILAWQQKMELLFGPARGSKVRNNVHQIKNKSAMDRYAASSIIPSLPGTLNIELSFHDPFDFIRIRDILNEELEKMDAEARAKKAEAGGAQ